jgi:hypothetical protein
MSEARATYTTDSKEPPTLSGAPPVDLCQQAVKLARRVQALPSGRVYALILVKRSGEWVLCVQGEGKAEVIR